MNTPPLFRRRPTELLLMVIAWVLAGNLASAHTPSAANREAQAVLSHSQLSAEARLEQHQAREWGLSDEDWTRYRQLMQGPLGTYSPNLDPLSALGIEARSNDERRRLAELQVRAEAQRTEKLLTYQRAYDEAWQRVFPHALRVVLPGAQSPAITGGGRLALFIKEACPPCDIKVRSLQAAGTPFDLYMVDSRQDDARIQQWAARVGITLAKVHSGTITLNHDAGRWRSLGVAGDLPAVVRETGGSWQRQ